MRYNFIVQLEQFLTLSVHFVHVHARKKLWMSLFLWSKISVLKSVLTLPVRKYMVYECRKHRCRSRPDYNWALSEIGSGVGTLSGNQKVAGQIGDSYIYSHS